MFGLRTWSQESNSDLANSGAEQLTQDPVVGKHMHNSDARIHRKRIYTEAKAKVVASVCGTEFIQFLAALLFCLGQFGRIG